MNWLKQNWFKIVLLTLLVFGFYWFYYRPSEIRSRCLSEAEFNQGAALEFDDVKRSDFINNYYNLCIKRFGLEK